MQETNLIQQDQPVGDIVSPGPDPAPSMTLCSYGSKLTREELARVATPAATATHKPIPHIAVVEKPIEALSFRQIGVVREEYAVFHPSAVANCALVDGNLGLRYGYGTSVTA